MSNNNASTLSAFDTLGEAGKSFVVEFHTFLLGHAFVVRVEGCDWALVLPGERPKEHSVIVLTVFFRCAAVSRLYSMSTGASLNWFISNNVFFDFFRPQSKY